MKPDSSISKVTGYGLINLARVRDSSLLYHVQIGSGYSIYRDKVAKTYRWSFISIKSHLECIKHYSRTLDMHSWHSALAREEL